MQKITKSVEIKAPAEKVFAFVSYSASPDWLKLSVSPMKVEKVTKGKTEKDTIYHFSVQLPGTSQWVEHDLRIVEWDPPRKLVNTVINGPFAGMRFCHHIVETAEGSVKYTGTVEYTFPNDIEGLTEKSANELLEHQNEEFVNRLKAILEEER